MNLLKKIRFFGRDSKGRAMSIYQCKCGNKRITREYNVKSGATKSCGCLLTVREDLIGKRFGRLIVLKRAQDKFYGKKKQTATCWVCQCDCGNKTIATTNSLRMRHTKSCKCLFSEKITTHGETKGRRTAEFTAWVAIHQRCSNPNKDFFHLYGGRGIKVCKRWSKFENFLADMGRKPSATHSIDRINNDGNYEPKNCRWATRSEQRRNRSDS